MSRHLIALAACAVALVTPAAAQFDTSLYNALQWRSIGPFRGGRVTAVAGQADQLATFYFGATGGGVWKTTDGGLTWQPVSDKDFRTGSIGAIEVAPSDLNVVYVGTGESPIRGNVSPGDGMYRSTDAGKTWQASGLRDAGQIGAIRVHPGNPDLVYVAVLGHAFGPNAERGVFRSKDGGRTWGKILFRSDSAGAIDLAMDPVNPRILYAAFWQARRGPWYLSSGGPGSGLFKSTDGGDTWKEITRNEGLPKGVIGKIGVTVSAANHDRVWAIVEAEDGGVFRSDDGGATWRRLNEERNLRQRAWYYSHIHADPKDPETVYVLNTGLYRSVDGGRTFTPIRAPHGDHHALWIAPNDPLRMINGNDGGANVSYNGGVSWTGQDNQPTAQFYHVTATTHFPYKVCGAQQDNSTVCIAARTDGGGGGITQKDWYEVGGGESGWIVARQDDPDIVYAGSYSYISRFDRRTGQERDITPWPENPMGWGAVDLKYRLQWTFPIALSPFNPRVLYVGAQVVFRSTNEGQSWDVISPDLTRNDKSKQGPSGGPITKDNTSVEYYNTLFVIAPSARDSNLIWVGTDDGQVQLSRDGGRTWTNVTPPPPRSAGMGPDQHGGALAPRPRHRVRRRDAVQVGRLPPLRLQDDRLRAHVAQDRDRDSRQPLHPSGARGPGAPRAAVRRGRVRRLHLLRRRRGLAVAAAQSAHRPGPRPGGEGQRSRGRHARPRLLDPGRSDAAAPAGRLGGARAALSLHAARPLPHGRGRRLRVRGHACGRQPAGRRRRLLLSQGQARFRGRAAARLPRCARFADPAVQHAPPPPPRPRGFPQGAGGDEPLRLEPALPRGEPLPRDDLLGGRHTGAGRRAGHVQGPADGRRLVTDAIVRLDAGPARDGHAGGLPAAVRSPHPDPRPGQRRERCGEADPRREGAARRRGDAGPRTAGGGGMRAGASRSWPTRSRPGSPRSKRRSIR